ncbi:glycoside hydrolase family 92 protein [bacterium]|nr:glycoside hydrolase family 92 protein [bacterium]
MVEKRFWGFILGILCLFLFGSILWGASSQKSYVEYVDTRIGSGGDGRCFPGVTLPFGMTGWTPQTRREDLPYHYNDKKIQGFRGTHFPSGSCMGDYGCITVMPLVGELRTLPQERASNFQHEKEKAQPHYYSVVLDDYGIKTEITATTRCGFFRFTFPKSQNAYVLIDFPLGGGYIKVIPESQEIVGYNDYRFKGYFYAKFNKPFKEFGTFRGNEIKAGKNEEEGSGAGVYIRFDSDPDEPVLLKIGTSFISLEQARKNLEKELPDWNFEKTVKEARDIWEKKLEKIEIEGTDDEKKVFYTALYHCLVLPRIFNEDGYYMSPFDGKIHKGNYYEDYSLWDTYRAEHPLLVLIESEEDAKMIEGLIRIFEEGGWMPKWPNPRYTNVMIGTHADSVIADAYVKGVRGFDAKKAYQAMWKDAMVPGGETPAGYYEAREGIEYYKELGYCPVDKVGEAVSNTLEGAYNDFCVAQMAKSLGRMQEYKYFLERSLNYRNVFDPETGFMRGRYSNGAWVEGKDPNVWYPWFTEANAWIYTWYVPHDVQGLINLIGGREKFVEMLDRFFREGHFDPGNEPSMQAPFMFDYAGAPWKTQEWIRYTMENLFKPTPDGIPGNDDCGQMSAWYIFSALGFYPVCPGQPTYEVGSPMVKRAVVHLSNGKDLLIIANNVSKENKFIQRAELNGKPLNRPFIWHHEIANGGKIEFWMGAQPNKRWGADPKLAPPSITNKEPKLEYLRFNLSEKSVEPNQQFNAIVEVKNSGGLGTLELKVFVDGKVVGSKKVVLGAGEKTKVEIPLKLFASGEHMVSVGNLPPQKVVVKEKPFSLEYENLDVIKRGSNDFLVKIEVKNIGGIKGTGEVEVKVDGRGVINRRIALLPGEEKTLDIPIYINGEGVHKISCGSLEKTVPVGRNLVLFLSFDNIQGNIARDSSGFGNDAMIKGARLVEGKLGSALSFNGVNDFLEISDSPSLNPLNAITIDVWIYPNDWNGNRRIIQKGMQDNQFRLTAEGGRLVWHIAGVSNGLLATDLPATKQWHHIVAGYDGEKGIMWIWLDGRIVAERRDVRGNIPVRNEPLFIGTKRNDAPPGDWFNGLIDEVKIYDWAVPPGELK